MISRSALLLLALLPLVGFGQPGDELVFKFRYKPSTTYRQTMWQSAQLTTTFSGTEEVLQKLREKKIQNPETAHSISKTEIVYKTGRMGDDSKFPITIEFVETTSSDGKKVYPDGTIIYGHCSAEKMPQLDSILSEGMDVEMKKKIILMVQNNLLQLELPEKRLKMGESFSIESPFSFPVAGMNLEFTITTTYTLLEISGRTADLEIGQLYRLRLPSSKYELQATGNGMGRLLYDVSGNFFLRNQINMEMSMSMKFQADLSVEIVSKSSFVTTTEISAN